MRMLTVSKNEAGQRLDKLLAKYLNLAGIIMCTTVDMWLWFPERWKKMKVPLPTG